MDASDKPLVTKTIPWRDAWADLQTTRIFAETNFSAIHGIDAVEHQRVLAVIPNFFVVYNWHAAPLTAKQKFRLALHAELDPFSFLGSAVIAGAEHASDTYPGYGQGAEGCCKTAADRAYAPSIKPFQQVRIFSSRNGFLRLLRTSSSFCFA